MPLCVIVDDHDDTREGFAEYLQVNGFEVLSAKGAEQACGGVSRFTADQRRRCLNLSPSSWTER